jgi:hypothetical protein
MSDFDCTLTPYSRIILKTHTHLSWFLEEDEEGSLMGQVLDSHFHPPIIEFIGSSYKSDDQLTHAKPISSS